MLSLLSLIIASGTVLRADTELWEPFTYPDPRTNATQCNTIEGSTLCDPDHILTDTWRQILQQNIAKQTQRLQNVEIQYAENASEECRSNTTKSVQIFVILAKRIHTASNQSITSNDLTNFGHGLREAFALDSQNCKNYILLLGVELAKEIYVWTGSDLALPKNQMDISLSQYKNLFIERNYMEGLNKIVDEIGDLLVDPFKDVTTTVATKESTSPIMEEISNETTTLIAVKANNYLPIWIYIVMILSVGIAAVALLLLAFLFLRRNRVASIQTYPASQEKQLPHMDANMERGMGRRTSVPYVMHHAPSDNEGGEKKDNNDNMSDSSSKPTRSIDEENGSTSGVSLPRSASLSAADRNGYEDFVSLRTPRHKISKILQDDLSSSDESYKESTSPPQKFTSKVCISPNELSTDQVTTRGKAASHPPSPLPHSDDQFASF